MSSVFSGRRGGSGSTLSLSFAGGEGARKVCRLFSAGGEGARKVCRLFSAGGKGEVNLLPLPRFKPEERVGERRRIRFYLPLTFCAT
jgi:hypothetical protein